jgi:hypothetical protein
VGKWRYNNTILYLGITWWVVSLTPRPLYPRGNSPTRTHWIGGWVSPRAGPHIMEERKIVPLPGIETRPSRPYPVAIPTELSRLSRSTYFHSAYQYDNIECNVQRRVSPRRHVPSQLHTSLRIAIHICFLRTGWRTLSRDDAAEDMVQPEVGLGSSRLRMKGRK